MTVAIFIVIASCFYAEENSRGLRVWQKAEREITARGESLNWDDYIPKHIPDAQNFNKAPMMAEWFVHSTNGTAISFSTLMANPETHTNFITESSASNYLAWSAAFEPQFNQIREALKRPAVWMDGDYSEGFKQPVPNFVNYRAVSQVLTHRAKCHLLLGQPAEALDDLTLLHHLNLTLVKTGKPVILVSSMIHTAIAWLYADAVACGLDSHAWREPELAALQKQLAEIHLLPAVGNSLREERASACHLLEFSTLEKIRKYSNPRNSEADLDWWFILPGGWVYQNMAALATLEGQTIACVDFTNETISPYKAKVAALNVDQSFHHETPYNYIAAVVTPNFVKALEVTSRNQTMVDQAQIVCALERYRLVNGKYPATLSTLVPQFLGQVPHDVITGTPMNYVRSDEQNFVLYSVGWNEADDGGITVRNRDGAEDRDNGDWVWSYRSP